MLTDDQHPWDYPCHEKAQRYTHHKAGPSKRGHPTRNLSIPDSSNRSWRREVSPFPLAACSRFVKTATEGCVDTYSNEPGKPPGGCSNGRIGACASHNWATASRALACRLSIAGLLHKPTYRHRGKYFRWHRAYRV